MGFMTETLQFTYNFLIFFLYDNCGMMYEEVCHSNYENPDY